MFGPEVIAAIQADAIARYPQESCGLITAAGYEPFANVHETPETQFEMPAAALSRLAAGEVLPPRALAFGGLRVRVLGGELQA